MRRTSLLRSSLEMSGRPRRSPSPSPSPDAPPSPESADEPAAVGAKQTWGKPGPGHKGLIMGLTHRPPPSLLRALPMSWRPWDLVAAHALWCAPRGLCTRRARAHIWRVAESMSCRWVSYGCARASFLDSDAYSQLMLAWVSAQGAVLQSGWASQNLPLGHTASSPPNRQPMNGGPQKVKLTFLSSWFLEYATCTKYRLVTNTPPKHEYPSLCEKGKLFIGTQDPFHALGCASAGGTQQNNEFKKY